MGTVDKKSIGRINNQRAAQAFCDYLKSIGIHSWYEADDSGNIIYIDDPTADLSTVTKASAELKHFLSNPSDPRYLEASWQYGTSNSEIKNTELFERTAGGSLKLFLSRSGVVTKSLVFISVLITLITSFGSNVELTKYLMIADITHYNGTLMELQSGEFWRIITPIFLHFMLIHILFNMMWLWDLGGMIEKNQSGQFLLFFVLSIGMMSNFIQFMSSGPAFGGMSGVVYGLLGYIWIRSRNLKSGYVMSNSIVIFMLAWLVLGFTGLIGAIGNAAHTSGLILGMAYGVAWNIYE